jgi:hypothetical protein
MEGIERQVRSRERRVGHDEWIEGRSFTTLGGSKREIISGDETGHKRGYPAFHNNSIKIRTDHGHHHAEGGGAIRSSLNHMV